MQNPDSPARATRTRDPLHPPDNAKSSHAQPESSARAQRRWRKKRRSEFSGREAFSAGGCSFNIFVSHCKWNAAWHVPDSIRKMQFEAPGALSAFYRWGIAHKRTASSIPALATVRLSGEIATAEMPLR